jgi:multiple sugar transport system ATP-binding protein
VVEELGTEVHVIFSIEARPLVTEATVAAYDDEAAEDLLQLADGRSVFTARVDARTKARPRERIRLAVDPAGFHFFDPDTGHAIGAPVPAPAPAPAAAPIPAEPTAPAPS